MVRIVTAVAAIVGLGALVVVLSFNAIATSVIFGVFAGVVTGLAIANLRRELQPKQKPAVHITHQHVHIYQLDEDGGQPEQISEASRSVTVTR